MPSNLSYFYELVLVINPQRSDQLVDVLNPYLELIKKHDGHFFAFEDWGKRRLAYPIAKMHKAHYVFLLFSSTPTGIKELIEALRYDALVLRHLIVRKKNSSYIPSEPFKENTYNSNALKSALNIKWEGQNEPEQNQERG